MFVKGYRFLSFAKNTSKNMGKKWVKAKVVSEIRKILIILNKSATAPFKTISQRAIQETAEETHDFIRNKIAEELKQFQLKKNWTW